MLPLINASPVILYCAETTQRLMKYVNQTTYAAYQCLPLIINHDQAAGTRLTSSTPSFVIPQLNLIIFFNL